MLKKYRTQIGFTLTELMIAVSLNTLIFGALIAIFLANLNHYKRTINATRLNQQLQSSLDLMTSEIRRAGFWANARNDIGTHANNNPFMTGGADVSINNTNTCILFSYDRNKDSTLPTINSGNDDERYGFRLIGQSFQSRPTGASFDCNTSASDWENLVDTNIIEITNLTFTPTNYTITTGPGTRGILMRSIDISITGRLKNNPSITKTLTQHVRIRNDKFIP